MIEVWAEGYEGTCEIGGAFLVAKVDAETLEAACEKLIKDGFRLGKYPVERIGNTFRIWGCRLFDNEADARKSYG